MKLIFTKALFVLILVLSAVISLTSCGKEHDLVSEFVVRDVSPKTQLGISEDHIKLGTGQIQKIQLNNQNKEDKSSALSAK